MKKILSLAIFLAAGSIHCPGQENVHSPSATEFVRYERIPVSYFNGLPSIEIPLYTAETKDLYLPISLSYHASGIKVNQYPTAVGLGWNLNAGGGIARIVNGIPDETCSLDIIDQTGTGFSGDADPGYWFSSRYMDRNDWASEDRLKNYAEIAGLIDYDTEPDEFAINAYGLNGSIYFYRDKDGEIHSIVKSGNGESFKVETPTILDNPEKFTFPGGSAGQNLEAYRIYKLFYEFTVIKNDGTRLIFGGDPNCIEFYTEKKYRKNSSTQYLKTLPSAWMLREVISPKGNRITFTYRRDGSPVIISDVITDTYVYDPSGTQTIFPSQDTDRGKSFIVQHPVYPEKISVDESLEIRFSMSKAHDLSKIREEDMEYLQYDGFSDHIADYVCYESSGSRISYAPHNYSQKLNAMHVYGNGVNLKSFVFSYTENASERLKLKTISIRGSDGTTEQNYGFAYNSRKLPAYNSPVTDNWGYWNNRNYRNTSIENDFFGFRSSSLEHTMAETLTEIVWPTGGQTVFEYELNEYSRIATQVPDFGLIEKEGTAGGLRIKKITYTSDTTSYTHSFKYEYDDGISSGILSGIPVYAAEGANHTSYSCSSWSGLVHFSAKGDIDQRYKMLSETYINTLGLTTGNHVTYSRVVELIGNSRPFKKEYRYTNHDSCPDTADFKMYTNIDNVALDNKFTSRALLRGLLTAEIWYNDMGLTAKETRYTYGYNPDSQQSYVRCIEKFSIPGLPGYLINVPFARYTPYKILTFYPYIKSKTETLYDTNMEKISTVKETYTYNGNLLLKSRTRNDSREKTETTTISYPDEYSGGIFTEMARRGITSSPVETVVFRDGKVTGGQLTEYSSEHSQIIPHKTWILELEEEADSSSFIRYNPSVGNKDSRYRLDAEILDSDSSGNPLLTRDDSKMMTSYQWGYSAAYPTAMVTNAGNTYTSKQVQTPARQTETILLRPDNPDSNTRTYTFRSSQTGDVTLRLSGALGYDWMVEGSFDGKRFNLLQMRSSGPDEEPWNRYEKAYSDTFTFTNVSAGTHTLIVRKTIVREGSFAGGDKGSMTYSWQGYTYHTEISGQNEFFYESFESKSGKTIYPFGYNSNRCHVGRYDINLDGNSDRRYVLDYRTYRNGKWEYVRLAMDGRSYTIDEGLNPIDEIRVWPENAEMETFTWYPHIGLSSRTDGSGATESYTYDVFGRLQSVRDNSDNIIRKYDYNYAGNTIQTYSPSYTNDEMSMQFCSSKCNRDEGLIPVPVTYTVPAYRYKSEISKNDANRMAFDDILANGQEYADKNGTCTSNIIILIYNPTEKTITLNYTAGTLGNYHYLKFSIPPGERTGYTGNTTEDYSPTMVLIPRTDYKSVTMQDESTMESISFTAESGYYGEFLYSREHYDAYTDTYMIKQQ